MANKLEELSSALLETINSTSEELYTGIDRSKLDIDTSHRLGDILNYTIALHYSIERFLRDYALEEDSQCVKQ